MGIIHHPPDETVLSYATGTLHAGPALVTATHLFYCDACRRRAADFEVMGGTLIDALPPETLSPNALATTLARIDAEVDASGSGSPSTNGHDTHEDARRRLSDLPAPQLPAGVEWPAPLRHYERARWRFLAPGLKWSKVVIPNKPAGHHVVLLRATPGTRLPSHGHKGTEYTCVLSGSFTDATGRFAAGDMIEAGEELDHQPITGQDAECICLIAMEGPLRLHGFLGWLLQPILGR